jgi:hypothetical protein
MRVSWPARVSNHRNLLAQLNRWMFSFTLRVAEKRVLEGVRVGILLPTDEERRIIFPKIAEALNLLGRHDPWRLARFRRDVSAVLVELTSGARGEWISAEGLVRLQSDYAKAEKTSALEIASTLVHEGTHAWIERMGVEYDEPRRGRIEAVCFRSQLAFLRRVPGSAELIADTERQLTRNPDYWTDAAFRRRRLEHLRKLGIPDWLVRVLGKAPLWAPSNTRLQRPGCSQRSHPAADPER